MNKLLTTAAVVLLSTTAHAIDFDATFGTVPKMVNQPVPFTYPAKATVDTNFNKALSRVPKIKDSVPIYNIKNGTAVNVDVIMGGWPVRMMLDTGANLSKISDALAVKIVRDGNGTWQDPIKVNLADGSTRPMTILLVKSVMIGSHTIRDVRVGVTSSGDMLLSFPLVNDIAPFTINTRAGELEWHY
jgi:hypothetical protein